MANEVWKPIKKYENFYEVSNKGRVRSVERLDARGQHRKSKVISIKSIRSAKQVTLFRDGKRKNFLVKKLDSILCAQPSQPPSSPLWKTNSVTFFWFTIVSLVAKQKLYRLVLITLNQCHREIRCHLHRPGNPTRK